MLNKIIFIIVAKRFFKSSQNKLPAILIINGNNIAGIFGFSSTDFWLRVIII